MKKIIKLTIFLFGVLGYLETSKAFSVNIVPGTKQLFIDDYIVEQISNLKKVMHQPEKRGAVLVPDIPSDGYGVQVRAAPTWVKEEGLYKVIYIVMAKGPAYAQSVDGMHWIKPNLGLVIVDGSTNNNHVRVDPADPWGINSIEGYFYDPYDFDPTRRYKGMAGALLRIPIVSSDSLYWTALDHGVPSNDEAQLVHDMKRGKYLMTVKTFDTYGRAVSLSSSMNFKDWSSPHPIFGADAADQTLAGSVIRARLNDPNYWQPMMVDPNNWAVDVYNMPVFPYEELYLGLPAFFYHTGPSGSNQDGFHHIQLVSSRDLQNWERIGNREPFIGPSKINQGLLGVWDRTQLIPTSCPIIHGGELWFYYSGIKWRDCKYKIYPDGSPRPSEDLSPEELADYHEGESAMCLAVLRLDGFVSLDGNSTTGYVMTKPVVCDGNELYVNADANHGTVKVEIVNSMGSVIAGMSASDCIPITEDGTRIAIKWNSTSSLKQLKGQTVKFKFYVNNASIYAFGTDIPPSDRVRP